VVEVSTDEVEFYRLRHTLMLNEYEGWAQVRMTWRNSKVVGSNEYVNKVVFAWLVENVGSLLDASRLNKYASGEGWAYGIGGTLDVKDIPKEALHPTPYHHLFFFKKPDDAVRFKLTWA
jgi:hypothetical protein